MEDWGETVSFFIFGCKSAEIAVKLWLGCYQKTRKWALLRKISQIFWKWLKNYSFLLLLSFFRQNLTKKWHFRCSKYLKNTKFPLPFHMIYGKKRPRFAVYPLFDLSLYNTYIHIYSGYYMQHVYMSGCFVLALCST